MPKISGVTHMKRLILIMFLVLSGGPAYAEWIELAYTDGPEGYTLHVDPDTIRRKGTLVKIWVLYDYKTIQKMEGTSYTYMSSRVQSQYDCVEERSRRLSLAWFSGNMANGTVVVISQDESKWTPVAPGSIGQVLWKFTCEEMK